MELVYLYQVVNVSFMVHAWHAGNLTGLALAVWLPLYIITIMAVENEKVSRFIAQHMHPDARLIFIINLKLALLYITWSQAGAYYFFVQRVDALACVFICLIRHFKNAIVHMLSVIIICLVEFNVEDAASDGSDLALHGDGLRMILMEHFKNAAMSRTVSLTAEEANCVPIDDDCGICRESLHDPLLRKLPCKHVYHAGCIDPWIEGYNYTCPCCRSPV